jgi:hypothetical protein
MRAPRRDAGATRSAILLALTAAVLSAVAPIGSNAQTEDPWLTLEWGAFSVMYREGHGRAAEAILNSAVERTPGLLAAVGLDELDPVGIFIASTEDEFASLTSGGVPDWGVGCAFPARGVVVLKSPEIVSYPLQMEGVVVHEVAHVAAGRVLGDVKVPRWLHEGVAMVLAGEWRLPESAAQSGASALGRAARLRDLSDGFPEGHQDAMLAYTLSFYAVRFLMVEAGFDSVGEMLLAIRSSGGFDEMLEIHYGGDAADLEHRMKRSFERRFGWGVFLSKWNVLFLVVALLFITGGALRIRRARRRYREWAEEERARDGLPGRGSGTGSTWQ